jgi:hypothetical protein
MKVRVMVCLGAVVLCLAALTPVARACSCFRGDPRTQLERADGAFIGRLTSADPAPPNAFETTYHFTVDEAVKGDIGKTIDVESSTSGASCGFEVQRGQQMGFFLDRQNGVWRGGLCGQVAPDDLRKAAKPYPKPDGSGPLALLVGGEYGEVRTIGLDAAGRTLQYGEGDGKTSHLSVCPGSHVVAEIVGADAEPFTKHVVLRDLDTFAGVGKSRLEGFEHSSDNAYPLVPLALACRSPNGDDVVVFGANNESDKASGRLIRMRPDGNTVIWQGGGGGAAALLTSGTKAYVSTQTNKLIEVDIETRAVRDIATTAGMLESGPAVSPDGRSAVLPRPREGGLDLFDIRTGGVTTNKTVSGRPVWVSDDRLVVTGAAENAVIVLDRSLKQVASWDGWTGDKTIAVSETLYGTNWEGQLVSAPALKGPMKVLRTFDSPELDAIAAVPPRQAPPAPGPTTTTEPSAAPSSEPSPEPTRSPAGFAAPSAASSDAAGSSSALPAAALAVSALALGGAAFTWRRRSA